MMRRLFFLYNILAVFSTLGSCIVHNFKAQDAVSEQPGVGGELLLLEILNTSCLAYVNERAKE